MTDRIEHALSKLGYLRARLKSIQELASSTDDSQESSDNALTSIEAECGCLLGTVDEIRKVLDPQLSA